MSLPVSRSASSGLPKMPSSSSLQVPTGPTRAGSGVSTTSSTLRPGASNSGSGSSTPLRTPHHSSSGVAQRLMHIFEPTKHADFDVTVTLHELGDVLVDANYEVYWRFKGRKPSQAEIHSKPSLPNLKLHQKASVPSSTNVSTPSLSSMESSPGPSSSSRPLPPALLSTAHISGLPRSSTAAPVPIGTPGAARVPAPRTSPATQKKPSDPTPLRQSLKPVMSNSTEMTKSNSADSSAKIVVEEPEEVPDLHSGGNPTGESSGSTVRDTAASGSGSGSEGHRSSSERAASSITSAFKPDASRPSLQIPAGRQSKHSSAGISPLSASSSRSHLSAPHPLTSVVPPTRSGTGPSASILIDRVPSRPNLTRMQTNLTVSSLGGSGPESEHGNHDGGGGLGGVFRRRRPRSSTHSTHDDTRWPEKRPGEDENSYHYIRRHTVHSSDRRRGALHPKPLKAHAVNWDFDLHHKVSIPVSNELAEPNYSGGPYEPRNVPTRLRPLLATGEAVLQLSVWSSHAEPRTSHEVSFSRWSKNVKDGARIMMFKEPKHTVGRVKPTNEEKAKAARKLFGRVEIDLAPFAGRGRLTRRFLFPDRPDNATVKVTVNLDFLGGEKVWTPPPLQGHHVIGITEFTGDNEYHPREIPLVHTDSNVSEQDSSGETSSCSAIPGWSGRAAKSATSLSQPSGARSQVSIAPAQSAQSLIGTDTTDPRESRDDKEAALRVPVAGAIQPTLSEHHVKLGPLAGWKCHVDAWRLPPGCGAEPDADALETAKLLPVHVAPPDYDYNTPAGLDSPTTPLARSGHHGKEPSVFSTIFGAAASGSNHAARAAARYDHQSRHASKHDMHLGGSLHGLNPEVIIEAVFNPSAAREEGPLTYVPAKAEEAQYAQGEEDVVEQALRKSHGLKPDDRSSAARADRRGSDESAATTSESRSQAAESKEEIIVTPPARPSGWSRMKSRAQKDRAAHVQPVK